MNSHTESSRVPETPAAEMPQEELSADEKLQERKEAALENALQEKSKLLEGQSLSGEGKLLFLLNTVKETKQDRINFLNKKNTVRAKKISRLEHKVDKLSARADRLEMVNTTIRSIFGSKLPKPVRLIVDANIKRAEKITEQKIPKRNNKISRHVEKIERNNFKISKARCAVNKAESLDRLIKSFKIVDKSERHEEFSAAMNNLKFASKQAVTFKLEKCESKLETLKAAYEAADVTDKFAIGDKIRGLTEKRSALKAKLEKYAAVDSFIGRSENELDIAASAAEKEIHRYAAGLDDPEIGDKLESISELSENVCASGCEAVSSVLGMETARPEAAQDNDIMKELAEQIARNNEVAAAGMEQIKSPDKGRHTKTAKKVSKIIGNVKYSDIQDKTYKNLTAESALEISKILSENGLGYSGKVYDNGEAIITIEKADEENYNKLVHHQEQSLGEQITANRNRKPEQPAEEAPIIFGDTKYADISDKLYIGISADNAEEISKMLTENGIKHSGRIYENGEAKLTISKSDAKKYKQLTAPRKNNEQNREASSEKKTQPRKKKNNMEL